MSSKSPASVLQELTVKHHSKAPVYTLISNLTKQGTHLNTFYYQLDALNHSTVGCGSSKQVARQDAATKLLKILEEEGLYSTNNLTQYNSVQTISCSSSYSEKNDNNNSALGAQIINSKGTLISICDINKLPMPRFDEVAVVGPSHCRQFTYDCIVGTMKTTATAFTKKQAQQLVAQEMIERINDMLPKLKVEQGQITTIIENNESNVINKYIEITTNNVKKLSLSTQLDEYDQAFRTVLRGISDIGFNKKQNPCSYISEQTVEEELEKLSLKYKFLTIQEKTPVIVSFELIAEHPFVVLGTGHNLSKARKSALMKAFMMIKLRQCDPKTTCPLKVISSVFGQV